MDPDGERKEMSSELNLRLKDFFVFIFFFNWSRLEPKCQNKTVNNKRKNNYRLAKVSLSTVLPIVKEGLDIE